MEGLDLFNVFNEEESEESDDEEIDQQPIPLPSSSAASSSNGGAEASKDTDTAGATDGESGAEKGTSEEPPPDSKRAREDAGGPDLVLPQVVSISGGSDTLVKGGAGTQSKNCIHECAFAPGVEGQALEEAVASLRAYELPEKLEKEYKFSLDPFQRQSIACIERNESVLVSAHTSAGKTAIAEYAIAKSLNHKQRVVYTSPIKALSNQKYRDLEAEFGDVGLITGDVTINPNASCLVMTTEILRSMLYRGSEILREVAWVVYDEIHYMRDKERGVVWEETIIMLPHDVHFVFLSATIPNAKQFAAWISSVHNQPCHVVYTEYRPTPLQHYMFPAGSEGLHLVVDEHGKFKEKNFQRAVSKLATNTLEGQVQDILAQKKQRRLQKQTVGSDLQRIVKMIMDKNYDPVIVFSFSKRDCETYANQLKRLDLTTAEEKKFVEEIFTNAIDSLSEDDRKLPQVQSMLPLLKRGIGVHHGGLLPLLKEIVEILFGEGLLKCLFATETFAMGINMPAKTVVFTAARKFDGSDFRHITAGEYIQMSGRAGRRGLDDRGIVIQMLDEKMEPAAAKDILKGIADPLNSTFHLGYNMLLNLLRVEDSDPQYMMRRCFLQYQNQSVVPLLQAKARDLKAQRDSVVVPNERLVRRRFKLSGKLQDIKVKMRNILNQPQYMLQFLVPGRLVRIVNGDVDWGWGVLVNYRKITLADDSRRTGKVGRSGGRGTVGKETFVLDVLLKCGAVVQQNLGARSSGAGGGLGQFRPHDPDAQGSDGGKSKGRMQVLPCTMDTVDGISKVRMFIPPDLKSAQSRDEVGRNLAEVLRRASSSSSGGSGNKKKSSRKTAGAASSGSKVPTVPLLDPVADMGVRDATFDSLTKQAASLEKDLNDVQAEMKSRIREAQKEASSSAAPKAGHKRRNADMSSTAKGSGEAGVLSEDEAFAAYKQKAALDEELRLVKERATQAQRLSLEDDLRRMKRVLRRLGHTDEDNVIQLKGQTASQISTADELVVTELMFNGIFGDLSAPQIVALLSALMSTEKTQTEGDPAARLPEELKHPFNQLKIAAKRVADISQESQLDIEPEEFVNKFSPDLMEITHAWTKGAKFSEIIDMTDQFEGSVIRIIRRLEELLRQLISACEAIGSLELSEKFKECRTAIKRDIVFAASLYL